MLTLLNCAFPKKDGTVPMFETFRGMVSGDTRYSGSFLFMLFALFFVIFAIVLAIRCNPNHEFAYGLLAFLFSEIYLIQFFIRKFVIKEKNYCTGIF